MNSIREIIHKNYLLTRLGYAMKYPGNASVIRLMRNKDNELVVMFQGDSGVKRTMGPAMWLDSKGHAHAWKVEGHPEFKPLEGYENTPIYITEGNVMSPEYAWYKPCMNPSLKHLKKELLVFKFRAYVYDMIMEKFKYGITFKRQKSFTNNEHFAVVANAELEGMKPFFERCAAELEKQFNRLAA